MMAGVETETNDGTAKSALAIQTNRDLSGTASVLTATTLNNERAKEISKEDIANSAAPKAPSSKCHRVSVIVESVAVEFVVPGGLDLLEVAAKCFNTEHIGSRVDIRLKRPRILFQVFSRGKVLALGAASEDEAKKGCRKIARLFQHRLTQGSRVRIRKYKITNMMASHKVAHGVRLDQFYDFFRKQFPPNDLEYFSDLQYFVKLNMENKIGINAKLMIWASGNVKLHVTNQADLIKAVKHLVPMLEKFKTDPTSAFLARRRACRDLSNLREKMKDFSSSSSSDSDDGLTQDPTLLRVRADRRERRLFEQKHLDRVWEKWAKYGKHGFLSSDEDERDEHSNSARPSKIRRINEKEARSYAAYDSSDD